MIIGTIKQTQWVQEFMNGEEITSNNLVKEQFEKYNINYVYNIYEINSTVAILATVDKTINLIALSPELDNLEGILYVTPNSIWTTGFYNDITIDDGLDTTQIEFRSINGKYWNFKVDENCIPYFMGN